ncbi:MAG: carboxypeptidase-like regulatory domain-containing protein [Flavobacteriales bacterium]|nr:carboxypeptidase-like regulatory domain-containing protein [Flavobacteriales bacterium]
MKSAITLVIIFHSFLSYGQNTIVAGYLTDAESSNPLGKGTILVENSAKGTTANNSGFYKLKFKTSGKIILHFSFVGYESVSKTIDLSNKKDTIWLNVQLRNKTQLIDEFSVVADKKPEKVHGTQQYSISDFEFYGNDFVFLTYEKTLKKGSSIVWVDRNQNLKAKIEIPTLITELYCDYRGRIYAIGDNYVYQLTFMRNRLGLTRFPIEDFNAVLKPCVDSLDNQIAFSDYQWFFPKFNYYYFDQNTQKSKKIYQIEDKELYHLYRMQYYFMHPKDKLRARKLANEYGMEKQDVAALMVNFTNTMYFEPLYAPLFVVNDTALIFDHYSDQILKIDEYGEKVDSVAINYHENRDEKWKKLLIKDIMLDEIYSINMKDGHLSLDRINTNNGVIENNHKLHYKYVDNIHIKDGYAYYIYRPYESVQKKYLYRELITEN